MKTSSARFYSILITTMVLQLAWLSTAIANPGIIGLSETTFSVEEGHSIPVTVQRSRGADGEVEVFYECVSGSALVGADFMPCAGWLTWADGEAGFKVVPLETIDDGLAEGQQTFHVQLSRASGRAKIHDDRRSASVVIIDNDHPEGGSLLFSSTTHELAEGQALPVLVQRVGGSTGEVTVTCSAGSGTAIQGADYFPIDTTITWPDGDGTPKIVVVSAIDDAVAEGTEWFNLTLEAPTGGAMVGGTPVTTVEVIDNEYNPAGSFALSTQAVTIEEGSTLEVQVVRRWGSEGEVAIHYTTVQASAADGVDYKTSNGTLTWSDGDVEAKPITVNISEDGLFEGAETFTIELSDPVGGAVLGSPSIAQVTIMSLDPNPHGTLLLDEVGDVDEGDMVPIVIRRTEGVVGETSVRCFSGAGSALAGLDYLELDEVVTWADGEGGAKVAVFESVDDGLAEGHEVLTISLETLSGEASLGNPSSTDVTIIDNDCAGSAGVIRFRDQGMRVEEGDVVVALVDRVGGSDCSVTVDYETRSGSALAGSDFIPVNGQLLWLPGEAVPKVIPITVVADSNPEGVELFSLDLGAVSGGAVLEQSTFQVAIHGN